MNELIKITEKNGQQSVSARGLHKFLEVATDFKDWMPRMLDYGFEDNKDFCSFLSESTGGRPSKEYVLTLDTAKEISMIQRSEKGRQARKYFIECENKLKLPSTYKEAILALGDSLIREEQLQLKANTLEVKLDVLLDWVSIIKIAKHNNIKETDFNWRVLKSASKKLGYEIKRSESPRFGYQNLYHINAFKIAYPQYNYNIKN